jgi:hypothetical protein
MRTTEEKIVAAVLFILWLMFAAWAISTWALGT